MAPMPKVASFCPNPDVMKAKRESIARISFIKINPENDGISVKSNQIIVEYWAEFSELSISQLTH
jgi:hypothetical protein